MGELIIPSGEKIMDALTIYADQCGHCFLCKSELDRWKIETIVNEQRAVCSEKCIVISSEVTTSDRPSKHFEDDGAYADEI